MNNFTYWVTRVVLSALMFQCTLSVQSSANSVKPLTDANSAAIQLSKSPGISITLPVDSGMYVLDTSLFFNDPKPTGSFPPIWDVPENTGDIHGVIVMLGANPRINNIPIEQGDYIGGFFLDENGNRKCGGADFWQDTANIIFPLFRDNTQTPLVKEGFGYAEVIEFRIFSWTTGKDYIVDVIGFDTQNYPSSNKWFPLGLSCVTNMQAVETIDFYISSSQNPVCYPGQLSLTAQEFIGNGGPYTFNWTSDPPGFSSSLQNPPIFTPTETRTYILTVTGGAASTGHQLTIPVNYEPTADAGSGGTICGNQSLTLQGTATNYQSVFWSSSGDGTFSGQDQLIGVYYPGTYDNGNITLTFSANPLQACTTVASDDVLVNVIHVPTANLGADVSICSSDQIILNSNAQYFSAIIWSTSGSGTFSSPDSTTTEYVPSYQDKSLGNIINFTVTANPLSGCLTSASDEMKITVTSSGPTCNCPSSRTKCENQPVPTSGTASNYSSILWTTSGDGTFVNPYIFNTNYYAGQNDKTNGQVILTLNAFPNSPCQTPATKEMSVTLTPLPNVFAGSNATISKEDPYYQIPDDTASMCGNYLWTKSGDGTFSSVTTLHPKYYPGTQDKSIGQVTLTLTGFPITPCTTSVSDEMVLTITDSNPVNAGPDQSVCGIEPVELYATTVNPVSYVMWSTSGGGYFEDETSLATFYFPDTFDYNTGTVKLIVEVIESANPGVVLSDSLSVFIQKPPAADAGEDVTICLTPSIPLEGIASNYSTLQWTSSGNGTFSNPNSATTNYSFCVGDIENGHVTLTFTAFPVSPCMVAAIDTKLVTMVKAPVINAGPDDSVCQGQSHDLFGSGIFFQTVSWTTSGDGTFSNPAILNPVYTPGGQDNMNGSVILTLTGTPLTPCTEPTNDALLLTILKNPTVDAGNSVQICSSQSSVPLSGMATNYSIANWTTSGDGSFSNSSNLVTSYFPGSNDIFNGSVDLTLTVLPVSPCSISKNDVLTVSIQKAPESYAGPDYTISEETIDFFCNDSAYIKNAISSLWETTGSGEFYNSSLVSTCYVRSAQDLAQGYVFLTLTALPITPCSVNVSDEMKLTFLKDCDDAIANPGIDKTLCSSDNVLLNGTTQYSDSSLWETSGDGTFADEFSLATEYFPGNSDLLTGSVELCLTAFSNQNCNDDNKCIEITLINPPTANAGTDATVCQSSTHQLSGSGQNYSSTNWSTSGDGTFNSASSLNAVYTPGTNDKTIGNVTLTLLASAISPCSVSSADFMVLTIQKPPSANAGSDLIVCQNISKTITGTATNCLSVLWTTSGNGTFSAANSLTTNYTPGSTDITNGNVTLTLTAFPISPCTVSASDNMILAVRKLPTANAGIDKTICQTGTAQITGTATNYLSVLWSTSGNGTFVPTNALNTVYSPGSTDIQNGSVTLTLTANPLTPCTLASTDQMVLTIDKIPTAEAGLDGTVCENAQHQLNGIAADYNTVNWTTSGNGTFNNSNSLSAIYTPDSNDISLGAVTLTLTATPKNNCGATATDSKILTIIRLPVVEAGNNGTICQSSTHQLAGTATNFETVLWSSTGNGTFSSASSLNPVYTPGSAEIELGTVTLTLTASPVSPCAGSVFDNLVLAIIKTPVVNVGSDANICETSTHNLAASATNNNGFTWSTSGNGTFSNGSVLNPVYTLGTLDKSSGTVTITLTAYPVSPCALPVSDDKIITVIKSPVVNAGNNAAICQGSNHVLNGTATNYSTIQWTTNRNGTFSDAGTLNPVYTPGNLDISNGNATLTLTATPVSPCSVNITGNLLLTIQKTPTANAGADATICQNGTTTLSGSATNYSSVLWTTSGNGNFNSTGTLTAVYTPGATDILNGSVILTLTANAVNPCTVSASDFMVLTIQKLPTADAGAETTICQNDIVSLTGTANNYSSIVWSTNRNGTFENPNSLTTMYYPGSTDVSVGIATLTLKAFSNAPCTGFVSDTKVLTIKKAPTANAGTDATICEGSYRQLSGSVTNQTSFFWSTTGDGTFSSSVSLTGRYYPGPVDRLNGSVALFLTANGNSPCIPAVDTMNLTIHKNATVNAGPDLTVCENLIPVPLAGTATNYSGINWSTNGSGTFGDAGSLTSGYYPGLSDVNTGYVTLTLTALGLSPCVNKTDQVKITFRKLPVAEAGNNTTISVNETQYPLEGASVANESGYQWLTSGDGTFTGSTVNSTIYNIHPDDKDNSPLTLTLLAFPINPCTTNGEDFMILSFYASCQDAIAIAGNDATVCENEPVALNGSSQNSGSIQWTTPLGDGTFENPGSLSTLYYPGENDILVGFVEICLTAFASEGCSDSTDCVVFTFSKSPVAEAGEDVTVCQTGTHSLTGNASFYSSIFWSTNGDGIFSPENSLNSVYTPGTDDIANGMATLTLTAGPLSPCEVSATDELYLTIQKSPTAFAGNDATICQNKTMQMNGAATDYSSITWLTSGDGTFLLLNSLNPVYLPGESDKETGIVILTLTASANSPCEVPAIDSLLLTIQKIPTAFAGDDKVICETETVNVSGTATNYIFVQWSALGDGTFENIGELNTVYTPGTSDILNGSVKLYFTAYPVQPCLTYALDDLTVTFAKPSTASAGTDMTICESDHLALQGTADNFSTIVWETSGDGTFDDPADLNANYYPGEDDIDAGMVTLTLTTEGPTACPPAVDELNLTIQKSPVVNAGAEATICESDVFAPESEASDFGILLWSTSGDGDFDDVTQLHSVYTPGTIDISAGIVTLTLLATPINPCSMPAIDDVILNIQSLPLVEAGSDLGVCDTDVVVLAASAINYDGVLWTTTGDGFFDDPEDVNTNYHPGAEDIAAASVILTLTVSPVAPCSSGVSDALTITIQQSPEAFAGNDKYVLGSNNVFLHDAWVLNANSSEWTTSGTGSFDNPADVNTVYNPSPDDYSVGSVLLALTASPINPCQNSVSSNVWVNFGPECQNAVAVAGSNATSCQGAPVLLSGEEQNSKTIEWSSSGDGTFENPLTLVTTYFPGVNDILLGSAELCLTAFAYDECEDSTSCLVVTISGPPLVEISGPGKMCETDIYVTLQANATGYSSLDWTTSGDGTFDNSAVLNPVYTPGVQDITDGSVELTLFAEGFNGCGNDAETMTLSIVSTPEIDILISESIICHEEYFSFADLVTGSNYTQVQWFTTNGGGNFSDEYSLQPIYYPSPLMDYSQGCVSLYVVAAPISPCAISTQDSLDLCFQPNPLVNAGDDATICESGDLQLSATAENYSAIEWTSTGDGAFSSSGSLTAIYTPGPDDIMNETATLSIGAFPVSPCAFPVSDDLLLTIQHQPEVFAGDDVTISIDDSLTLGEAYTKHSLSNTWSTSGDGNFDDIYDVNTTYHPGNNDKVTGSVTLTLVAEPNEPCTQNVSDEMTLFVGGDCEDAVAVAGSDIQACAGDDIFVNGTAFNYSSVLWESGGDGSFDDSTNLSAQYFPGTLDFETGSVKLCLTAFANDTCQDSTSCLTITFFEAPYVEIPAEMQMCSALDSFNIPALITDYSSVLWTSGGDGTFNDNGIPNPNYYPGENDLLNGSAVLNVAATGFGNCGNSSGSVTLFFVSPPEIDILSDELLVCYDDIVVLTGLVTGENFNEIQWFTTNGGGFFENENTLQPVYYPSPSVDYPQGCIEIHVVASAIPPCVVSVSDAVNVCFQPYPMVDAGDEQVVQVNEPVYLNDAHVQYYESFEWTTNGDGTFSSATVQNPIYYPGINDTTNHSVILTLTANPINPCSIVVSDEILIEIATGCNDATAFAGDDKTVCLPGVVSLSGTAGNYDFIIWETSGDGTFSDKSTLETQYFAGTDDESYGIVTITLKAIAFEGCQDASDVVVITFANSPEVNAGNDISICKTQAFAQLSGTAGYYDNLLWTTSGDGIFDQATALNTNYYPGIEDKNSGNVVITFTATNEICGSISDSLVVFIIETPVANAGNDATICQTGTANLTGTATNYSGVLWTTSGNGTFAPANSLTAVYTPGTTDISNGYVNLTLTANAISPCVIAATDVMVLSIQKSPTANAGADATICQTGTKTLTGTATNYYSVLWATSGNGSFSSAGSLTTVYTPGSQDIANGTVNLTLTAAAISPCTVAVSDVMVLTIQKSPTANAGADATICQTGTRTLAGTAANYSSVLWTTSGNGTFNSASSLAAVYTPGSTDIANGTVNLTLTAAAISPCTVAVSDFMILTVRKSPTANAGADATICQTGTRTLAGTAANYSSVLWTTSGNGSFSSAGSLTTVYTPGSTDIANGTVNLTLTAAAISPCTVAVSDVMVLTIQKSPTANAGADATICETGTHSLNASATNYSSVQWFTDGDGSFSSLNSLTPVYTPGDNDIDSQSVILTITAASISPCSTVASNDMILHIQKSPTAYAGNDATICQTETFTLAGIASSYSAVSWSTAGDGTFSPTSVLNPVYTPGAADISEGIVSLTLNASAHSPCAGSVSDFMILSIQKLPSANAGADATICQSTSYSLSGTAMNNSGVLWTTSGDGSFSSTNTLNPVYSPGSNDNGAGSVILTLAASAISPCVVSADDAMVLSIQKSPVANAGADATVCDTETHFLSGTASNQSGVLWTTAGDGTFSQATLLNSVYTPGTADISSGSAILTLTAHAIAPCDVSASDILELTIQKSPTASAGDDALICETQTWPLSGTATDFSSVLWTTSGDGNFNTTSSLTTVYTPGTADISNGTVNLTLTASAISPCSVAADDFMVLNIQQSPDVFAGDDASILFGQSYLLSDATAQFAAQTYWQTSGTGTFESVNVVKTRYYHSEADSIAGSVILTLAADAINPCTQNGYDEMVLSFSADCDDAIANAGEDFAVCTPSIVTVSGSAENYSGLLWQTSGDGTFGNSAALNTQYYPGPSDYAQSSVTLSLTAFAAEPCADDTDEVVVGFINPPSVNAGNDFMVCLPDATLLSGTAQNAVSILWETNGDGTFGEPTALATTYYPGPNDLLAMNATLCLIATGNEPCTSVEDCLTVIYNYKPVANAGNDVTVCQDIVLVDLTGSVSHAASYVWSTSGDGIILSPGNLTTKYKIGANDIANGEVNLILSATNSNCGTQRDTMLITILPEAFAYAGEDATICGNDHFMTKGAFATNASSVLWETNGDGTFDNPYEVLTNYHPGIADNQTGAVDLCLTAIGFGDCDNHSWCLNLTLIPSAYVNAGNDTGICNNQTVGLNAVGYSYESIVWMTTGDGTFTNSAILNPFYTPGPNDIASKQVNLYIIATSSGECGNAVDTLSVSIENVPEVMAGSDATLCENENLSLSGQALHFDTVEWQSSGDGTFDQPNAVNPVYYPGIDDVENESVLLTLTAVGHSPCAISVSDALNIVIQRIPEVNAGVDVTICNNENYQLEGSAANYVNITWTTDGDGTFSSVNSLNPVYIPGYEDTENGWAKITLEAVSASPCNLASSDFMYLVIDHLPEIVFDLEDTEAELYSNVFLVVGAVDGDEYQWYGPLGFIPGADGSVLDLINVNHDDAGHYYCIVSNSCGADTSEVIYLDVYESQYVSFPSGWSGMSSYIEPRVLEVEGLFEPIVSQMILLENFTGCYWPGVLNTLGNYDPLDGYKAKFTEASIFEIRGSANQTRTITLQQGWNYLPVISTCPANVAELFGGNSKVQIIKEIAGMGIYWPAVGINTIVDMIPGRAYFIRVSESFSITYPDCPPAKSSLITADVLKVKNNSVWNQITYTPVTHIVAIDDGLYEILKPGDILGAFTPDGLCAGYLEMDGSANGLSLFNDDHLTPETDGFVENDLIRFRVYRPATGEEFNLNVTFDSSYPDNDGLFSANGLSAIMKSETSYLSVFEYQQREIVVYPNPTNGKINISGMGKNARIEIVNAEGQLLNSITCDDVCKTEGAPFSLNISGLTPGVVFVKIIEPDKVTIKKIILQ